MKILDKSFDFSHILGLVGASHVSEDPFGIGKKMEELKAEGFDYVVAKSNQYGFPRFVYAMNFGDEYLTSSAAKEDELAGFRLYAISKRAIDHRLAQVAVEKK